VTPPAWQEARRARARERVSVQEGAVRCDFCEWSMTGVFGDLIPAAKRHRATQHPEVVLRPPVQGKRRRSLPG
jgi:uncharacterized membrane protein